LTAPPLAGSSEPVARMGFVASLANSDTAKSPLRFLHHACSSKKKKIRRGKEELFFFS
jgi:hypothetical protein